MFVITSSIIIFPTEPLSTVCKLLLFKHMKPWPNDHNMPTQHTTTLLGTTMLHVFGHHVASCWVLLAQIWPFSNLSQQHPTCCNMSQHGGQTHATCCTQQYCYMLRWCVTTVWSGLNLAYGSCTHSMSSSQNLAVLRKQHNNSLFLQSYEGWLPPKLSLELYYAVCRCGF